MAVPHPAAFAVELASDYAQMRRSWYIFLFQLRGMAEAVIGANDFAFLRNLWRDWSPDWMPDSDAFSALTRTERELLEEFVKSL